MRQMSTINFAEEAFFDYEDGVYRWKSNRSIPFDDMLKEQGVSDVIRLRCNEIRAREVDAFMEDYIRREKEFWTKPEFEDARNERLAEMRAELGPGATTINVITGRKTTL